VAFYGSHHWVEIADEFLKNKFTNKQCRFKYIYGINPKKIKGPWSIQEDAKLLFGVGRFGANWSKISRVIFRHERTGKQCLGRYEYLNPELQTGAWSTKETKALHNLYARYKNRKDRWRKIASKMPTNRNRIQCYQKYVAEICKRGRWSTEDRRRMVKGYLAYGPKWVKIADEFFKNERTGMELGQKYAQFIRQRKWKLLLARYSDETRSANQREVVDQRNSLNGENKGRKRKRKDSSSDNLRPTRRPRIQSETPLSSVTVACSQHLKNFLSQNERKMGSATQNGDSFYDSFAQGLASVGQTVTIKELRETLATFLKTAKKINTKTFDAAGGQGDYSAYLDNLPFTFEEHLKEAKPLPQSGIHQFEGIILAHLYNVSLAIYEIFPRHEEELREKLKNSKTIDASDFIIKDSPSIHGKPTNPTIEMAFYPGQYAPIFKG
jgi:hypothetical protein